MENSLARPSFMGCQSHGERRDGLTVPTRSGPSPRRTLPTAYQRKRGHRAGAQEFRQQVADYSNDFRTVTVPTHHRPTYAALADGFVNSSSKWLLFPGTLADFNKSVDEVPNWDSVAEVHLQSESTIKCPICLCFPMLPRIDRCGHVYCAPCVVQYIRYENSDSSKKCAVCSWILSLKDLKRTKLFLVEMPKLGSNMEMTLVKRTKFNGDLPTKCIDVRPVAQAESKTFLFVMEMSWYDINIERESDRQSLLDLRDTCLSEGDTELVPHLTYLIEELDHDIIESDQHQVVPAATPETSPILTVAEDAYYFYQASDGRFIFLDGLMWNCLLSDVSSASDLPTSLNVSIVAIRPQKMTPVSRKRWRHLSHIPLGHPFAFVDIDLKPLVSEAALEQFALPLKTRALERERQRLVDLKLTELKEAAENQIPSLPSGFVLSGQAELPDYPSQCPLPSEFMPLCPPSSGPSVHFRTSFAEVTKCGARAVVGQNRIAKFSKTPISSTSKQPFNPATEVWPSLGDPAKPTVSDTSDCNQAPSTVRKSAFLTSKSSKECRKKASESTSSV